MKKILGLDLGTNSIGWALVEQDFENHKGNILGMGSRIIPMDAGEMGKFAGGELTKTGTSERTGFRSTRRLRERHLLRRERLHRVLNVLGFLPEHYSRQIDFVKRLGQFLDETEPKLAYNKKDFIFKKSFEEMLGDFKKNQPELLNRKNKKDEDAKIPYDWTIYYLRKKGLSQKLEKEELAWVILNFNQKRGYYQLRGEEEDVILNKLVEFHSLKIVDVVADEQPNNKGDLWYSLHLENGWIYRRSSKTNLSNWKGKLRDFIVTTDLNDDGSIKTDKEGNEKRSFRAPGEDDWTLLKKKTEQEIIQSEQAVGTYIYNTLLQKPDQKIRGKLVRTIERKFYKDELIAILEKQIELQPELFSNNLYNDCVRELYRHNEAHQLSLSKRDFTHLFVEDIIFYQRPLKSKKSSIGNCSLEFRKYKLKDIEGKEIEKTEPLKAISKSHPLYQEFRVWQWLFNLKIYKKDDDTDVTPEFIKDIEDLENLFEFLMSQKEVDHKTVLKHLLMSSGLKGKALNAKIDQYRWNYVYNAEKDESKKYPCNETGYEIRRRLMKVLNLPDKFLTPEMEQQLWHIIYSVTDKHEFEKALKSFATKQNLDEESFVENFKKFRPFESNYGSYSEKATKKLLSLMRLGKYWNWDAIDTKIKDRIEKILTGEYDEEIKNRVRDKAIHLTEQNQFQGLQLWLAQYIVYDRHSEASLGGKWKSVTNLEGYLQEFKQHSLRNPIVEQVVTETLRVVRDIWKKYGNGAESYFSEIHIELGREMKNTAEDRKKMTSQISDNENTNLRIKALIVELKNDSTIENVRPFSPMQQEALKIYEDGALNSNIEIPDDIIKISRTAQPTKSELQRYKLWLEQRYRSPYTGEVIPLSRLFTEDYQIEHVIPQSRYFDNSFTNKVICESAVNQLKDNQLGLEFIKNHHGEIVETGRGNKVKIFTGDEYEDFVKRHYDKNRNKRNKMLLDEIPDKMIERQLNDTRYISKFVSSVLSNIVRIDDDRAKKIIADAEILSSRETDKKKADKIREKAKSEANDDGVNSKNLISGNGKITSILKQEWGLNDVWNNLILPRFERMNQLTNTNDFTSKNSSGKSIPTVPLELSKGFQKKRIDHRHHALDALIIACATRDHVNLLNNQSANSETKRYDLQYKLRNTAKWTNKFGRERDKFTEFKKPWESIAFDALNELGKIIVSFKQNLRVINKTNNKYESYKDENGQLRMGKDGIPKKGIISQKKGDSWAIRKPLHKSFVFGEVDLARIKVPNGKRIFAIRRNIDPNIDLEKITDSGIKKILQNYLKSVGGDPEFAFSPEGLEEMNKNIEKYNRGKSHKPIFKVRTFEVGSRFHLGAIGNKKYKHVETADSTNLFFAVYKNKETGKRMFDTVPLNEVIEHQKQQSIERIPIKELPPIAIKKTIDVRGKRIEVDFLFTLSPNDLVYLPTEEEIENINGIDFTRLSGEQIKRIFKVNDFSNTCYFTPNHLAKNIAPKEVDLNFDLKKNKLTGSYDTKTASFEGRQIKDECIKLKVDRLGKISKA